MKTKTTLEIKTDILKNWKKILSNTSNESVSVYIFLKSEFRKGNIGNNFLFQFVFKSFYALNSAGLGDDLKKRYFELFANGENNLEKILQELYKIKNGRGYNTVQFSFATKLLHTINNNNPIFDSEVSKALNLNVYGQGKVKIQSCLKKYDILKNIYQELLENLEIQEKIIEFRNHFHVNKEEFPDTKALDSIIWSLGKLQKK